MLSRSNPATIVRALHLVLALSVVHASALGHAQAQQPARRDAARIVRFGVGVSGLPAAVAETHAHLLEAAASGRVEEMAAVAELNELKPAIADAGAADVASSIRALSGSGDGKDVLAEIAASLGAPWLAVPQGRDVENAWIYVWPAGAASHLTQLTADEQAALAKLTPSQTPQSPPSGGTWSIGIGADGTWHFLRR